MLLRNVKYIGIWSWGRKTNVRDPDTGRPRQEDRSAEEVAQLTRQRPTLRIVEDGIFFKAQAILDKNQAACAKFRDEEGLLKGSGGDVHTPRHVLQGLLFCQCGRPMHTNGAKGRYMVCSAYLKGGCPVKTRLPRKLAWQKIAEVIRQRLFQSVPWFEAIYEECQAAWEVFQRENPGEERALEDRIRRLEHGMKNLLDQIESGSKDPDIMDRIANRRDQRNTLARQLQEIHIKREQLPERPTIEWMRDKLQQSLETVLSGGLPEAAYALRGLIGRIVMEEVVRPSGKRKMLRGTFMLDSVAVLRTADNRYDCRDQEPAKTETIAIDFVDALPWEPLAAPAKQYLEQGLDDAQIAEQLGCPKLWIPKALKVWCAANGTTLKELRAKRPKPQAEPTKAMLLSEPAKKLWDIGMKMQDIAVELTKQFGRPVYRDDVTRAIDHWFTSRGLSKLDGRTRRRQLTLQKAAERKSA